MTVVFTRDQIRRVDKLAIEQYAIAGVVLMENAGRNAAEIIRREFGPSGRAVICCGPGNNGGDGCVIARHLHNTGWSVRLLITGAPDKMSPDMLANFRIVEAMKLDHVITTDGQEQRTFLETVGDDEVVIDALLGTGFRGEVRSPTAELIEAINSATKCGTVAIDIPSGLDCDTGEPSNATIRADWTITFVARKTGLVAPPATPYVGKIEVADIGVPRELIAEIASARTN